MDGLPGLQSNLLHIPPHLLPPLNLRHCLHDRLHLHRPECRVQEGNERGAEGLEAADGHFLVHLLGYDMLQHDSNRNIDFLGSLFRIYRFGGSGLTSSAGSICRGLCLHDHSLATGLCGVCVGGRLWAQGHDQEQGADQRKNRSGSGNFLQAQHGSRAHRASISGACGGREFVRAGDSDRVWNPVLPPALSAVPVRACGPDRPLLRLQVVPPREHR